MDADVKKIVDERMKQYFKPISRSVISGDMSFNEYSCKNDLDLHPMNRFFGFLDWFIKYNQITYVPILFVCSLAVLFFMFM